MKQDTHDLVCMVVLQVAELSTPSHFQSGDRLNVRHFVSSWCVPNQKKTSITKILRLGGLTALQKGTNNIFLMFFLANLTSSVYPGDKAQKLETPGLSKRVGSYEVIISWEISSPLSPTPRGWRWLRRKNDCSGCSSEFLKIPLKDKFVKKEVATQMFTLERYQNRITSYTP